LPERTSFKLGRWTVSTGTQPDNEIIPVNNTDEKTDATNRFDSFIKLPPFPLEKAVSKNVPEAGNETQH
jgi:hypothetical protein